MIGLDLNEAARFGAEGVLYVSAPAFGADARTGQVLRLDVSQSAQRDRFSSLKTASTSTALAHNVEFFTWVSSSEIPRFMWRSP